VNCKPVSSFKILCGVGLLAIFSSTISKSPALPLLVSHLGGGPSAIGLIASISACAGILFSFPAGILSDRIGRKRMLVFSAIVFATAPFCYLLVREIWQLALVRFYHGLATAIFVPVAMSMVADLYQQGRGEKMGWFSTATLLGRFVAPAVGGALLGITGYGQETGFHLVYLTCGMAGLVVLPALLLLPDVKVGHQRGSLPSSASVPGTWRDHVGPLFRHRGIMITCGMEAAILFAYGIFETFLPVRGVVVGLSAWQIGLCLSSQVITIALAKPALGRFSDLHGRPVQILVGALFCSLCMALLAIVSSFWSLLVASILLGLAISVVTSASAANIADLSKGSAHGSAMGILGSIMDLGHTTGPMLGGFLAASLGLPASFLSACAMLLAAGVVFYLGYPGDWRVSGKAFRNTR